MLGIKKNKCKHTNTSKIGEIFEGNDIDNYYATNYGGGIITYGYDILKCDKCNKVFKVFKVFNGKRKYDGREI